MNTCITDNMAKEAKPCKYIMIFGYVLAVITPLSILLINWLGDGGEYTNQDGLLLALAYFLLGFIGLYYWLYAIKYKLVITETQISVHTLFRSLQVPISEIRRYSCKKYKKSVFYQFTFFTDKGSFMISTRYRDALVGLLSKNNILEDC